MDQNNVTEEFVCGKDCLFNHQCIIMSIYRIFLIQKKYSLNYQDFMYIPFRASYHNRVVSSNLGDWSHFEKLLVTLLCQTFILINVYVRNKSNNFVFHFHRAYPGIMWPNIAPFIVTRVCKFRLPTHIAQNKHCKLFEPSSEMSST